MKVATLLAPLSVNLIRLRKYLNNTLHHVEKDGGAEEFQHNSIFCHAKQQCNYSESHRTVSVATTKTAKSGHCCTLASRPITRQRLKPDVTLWTCPKHIEVRLRFITPVTLWIWVGIYLSHSF